MAEWTVERTPVPHLRTLVRWIDGKKRGSVLFWDNETADLITVLQNQGEDD